MGQPGFPLRERLVALLSSFSDFRPIARRDRLVETVRASASPAENVSVNLRAGGSLELLSDVAFDTWVIHLPAQLLVGPFWSDEAGGKTWIAKVLRCVGRQRATAVPG